MFEPTQVVFSSNTDLLFIGTSCGLIRIYSVEFRTESRLWYVKLVNEFFAHKSSISSLKICDDFHIILSTSIDAKACLWDSNHLTFVRTIKPPTSDVKETITLTGISSISADVAIVYQSGKGSRIVLFTVNGDVIGTYSAGSELTISSLAMTNMEEGTGINCLALGLQNGVIRLLETWTLSVVCDISAGSVDPVIGLEFGNEARRLYAALANGRVLCWQILIPTTSNSGSIKSKTVPNFRMINPFVCFLHFIHTVSKVNKKNHIQKYKCKVFEIFTGTSSPNF
uniref:Uncharacterized protein n=1 Tax=Panagrolaimus sp. JU765 TaxID=591449 RepID=A0AC34QL95_9BILA